MPLARYLLFVGGVLLALLFVSDPFLPKLPVADWSNSHSAIIRIHSDQKWPERVVYDTSLPTLIPAQIENVETDLPGPARVGDVVKAMEREAFAQLQLQPSDAIQLQRSDPKKREPKLQRQRKKIAKRQAAPAARLVARQPQFGWFGNSMW
jgi:hypothetical protein